jgi:hypothetical protein
MFPREIHEFLIYFFADDVLLFTKASKAQMRTLLESRELNNFLFLSNKLL